jgi:chromosomal replication initiator protein
LETIWKDTVKIIKESISQPNFDTWIKPIRVLSLEDRQIHLAVPNKFFKDWVAENYTQVIRDSLIALTGKTFAISLDIHQDTSRDILSEASPDAPAPGTAKPKSPRRRIHPTLNINYSFERFVVGASNQFAHAASVSAAEQPAKNYNPLFIYGGVGLGKTHLLNAIGLRTLSLFPDMNVVYVSAEAFMNELIHSIRFDLMPKFRDKFRNIECLLIDDIQFIAGKERTQEEFFHTFNTLHDAGKQIVVTSDKFPKEIPNLESRLRSRFEWGLIADIQPPEIETKIAIITKKAQENGIQLPDNVAYYIANNAESNIREMEGFLLRIVAFASLKQRPIDIDLVKEVLKHMVRHTAKDSIAVEAILRVVGTKMGVKVSDIKSAKKNKTIAMARQTAMYLSRKLTPLSFPDIGEKIGKRDHSTVIYACKKIEALLEKDSLLQKDIEEMEETIHRQV